MLRIEGQLEAVVTTLVMTLRHGEASLAPAVEVVVGAMHHRR
jgi:hypothetical protein